MNGKLIFGYHGNKAHRIVSGAKKREKRARRRAAKLAVRGE
jgi:hypothetical protein